MLVAWTGSFLIFLPFPSGTCTPSCSPGLFPGSAHLFVFSSPADHLPCVSCPFPSMPFLLLLLRHPLSSCTLSIPPQLGMDDGSGWIGGFIRHVIPTPWEESWTHAFDHPGEITTDPPFSSRAWMEISMHTRPTRLEGGRRAGGGAPVDVTTTTAKGRIHNTCASIVGRPWTWLERWRRKR